MLTKEWIHENCMTRAGKLNNRVCIESWWENRNIIKRYHWLTALINQQNYGSISEALYCIYHGVEPGKCLVCQSPTAFLRFSDGYRAHCSVKCTYVSPERIGKIKTFHSTADYADRTEKAKATNLLRYGVESTSKMNVTKSKQTKLERYGNENYCNNEKRVQTLLERYGVSAAAHIPSTLEKTKQVRAEKLPQLRDVPLLRELNKTLTMTEIANNFNVHPSAVVYWFRQHGIKPKRHFRFHNSQPQKELSEFCQSLLPAGVVKNNDRETIDPKELDILIPSHNIAIEYNGLYWHKEKKLDHLFKTEECNKNNIRLLQFWCFEWANKPEICKSLVMSALGLNRKIYARSCTVQDLTVKQYKDFLNDNHIQGYAPASTMKGLMHNGELVSVIGISKTRYNKSFDYELIRACSQKQLTVTGGLSKLLKSVQLRGRLISYCDRRLFTGIGYQQAGFNFEYNSRPNYFYWNVKTAETKSRISCQKHKLEKFLEYFDPDLTEHQNMLKNHWFRIYDSGNSVWSYDLRSSGTTST